MTVRKSAVAATTAALVVALVLAVLAPSTRADADDPPTTAAAVRKGASQENAGDAPASSRLGLSAVLLHRQTERPPPEFFPEAACSSAGGLCLRAHECPVGQLAAQQGLCPKQRALGVECCHGVSVVELQCTRRGGECRPTQECPRNLRDALADDCKKSEACCIQVAL